MPKERSRFYYMLLCVNNLGCHLLDGDQLMCAVYKHSHIFQVLFLPPANVVCEGYVFTGVCHSFCSQGGRAWFYWGGMRGFIRGGMHGFIRGGMHGFIRGEGMSVVLFGGEAWFFQFFRIQ